MRWAIGAVVVLLAVTLVITLTRLPTDPDPLEQVRAAAAAATQALDDGDLAALDTHLAANRGQTDFAYFFSSKASPRALGDALAMAAGNENSPLNADFDSHAYDLTLTDLAGTLALSTHGVDNRALPESWTEDFILATTTPASLYGGADGSSARSAERRAYQDLANKQNLLLLLSRGYWSTDFLKSVTTAYWDFDHDKGDDAWPTPALDDAKYAPAPNGVYLTDGMLALTAALTANPVAADWAFSDFQSGTETVEYDGNDHHIGKFTHYLFFEHQFPEASDGDGNDSVGMTAVLTALSAAIEVTTGASEATGESDMSQVQGPMADALVLEGLAKDSNDTSGGSIWSKPWDVTKSVAEVVWRWIQRWGHRILDILTFTPPPFGTVAAGTNTVWHTIDGDYADAGLSLAAAVPVLAFIKIAKAAKAGAQAEKTAAETTNVAKAAKEIRAGVPVAGDRVKLRVATESKIRRDAPRDADGNYIDPNTGKSVLGKGDIGHKPGFEWKCTQARALAEGWTREQLIEYENDPTHYQIEDPSSNRSHRHEATCAR